ncbi:FAD/NAD(P)-binding domain-containing protein [Gonapodya prolifera JEL478]|uniref:FAD/NAD(P)-binding domain-containing protein n=1 Tax=Gonapodya prolifera (strain JEL478) TaxID=1344416 RepID=A0A138ZZZ5_GONPJ|nr:FAD/NAD(P)-binding domain-containing protein [Gonapodya prolifera JEL478]|eukprot:KXS10096.1 FAD/NAD(P)-binding domain-containing protein [Gonapodya prolifera JEL478]
MSSQQASYVVIGAGPVGLLAALGLAKRGHSVTVYEGRESLDQRREESYPIGVNLRGIRALRDVGGSILASRVEDHGEIIDSFDIYSGKRRVAQAVAGTIRSQTRFAVTKAIYDECVAFEASKGPESKGGVRVVFGKKLDRFEVVEDGTTAGRLHFSDQVVDLPVGVRVVAADGGGSIVRRCFVEATKGKENEIKETLVPWNVSFRVMFCDKSPLSYLDPKIHYIMSGVYVAVSGSSSDPWTFALSCRPGAPHHDLFHLHTDSPTPAQIEELRAHLRKACPLTAERLDDHISEEELRAFFGRRIFTGNLVHISRCDYNGWVVMLGDAAHALFPPTGEGINSGLDDVHALMSAIDATSSGASVSPFSHYATNRQPSVDALHSIARDIWLSQSGSTADKIVSMGSNILFNVFSHDKSKPTEAELRYGPPAKDALLEYPEVWKRHLENVGGYRRALRWIAAPFGHVTADQ